MSLRYDYALIYNPDVFLSELPTKDIGIATYLMLLWKQGIYSGAVSKEDAKDDGALNEAQPWLSWPRPPKGFLDLGCVTLLDRNHSAIRPFLIFLPEGAEMGYWCTFSLQKDTSVKASTFAPERLGFIIHKLPKIACTCALWIQWISMHRMGFYRRLRALHTSSPARSSSPTMQTSSRLGLPSLRHYSMLRDISQFLAAPGHSTPNSNDQRFANTTHSLVILCLSTPRRKRRLLLTHSSSEETLVAPPVDILYIGSGLRGLANSADGSSSARR